MKIRKIKEIRFLIGSSFENGEMVEIRYNDGTSDFVSLTNKYGKYLAKQQKKIIDSAVFSVEG